MLPHEAATTNKMEIGNAATSNERPKMPPQPHQIKMGKNARK
jgi:hypothetical protein